MKSVFSIAVIVAAFAVSGWAAERGAAGKDGEVLHAIRAANEAEIAAAKTALQKARRAEVKEFAQMMQHEHKKSNEEVAAFVESRGIETYAGVPSRELKKDATLQLKKLQAKSADTFDDAYMAQQIEAHTKVLATLDEALQNSESLSSETQQLVQRTRGVVQKHLEHARSVQSKRGAKRPSPR